MARPPLRRSNVTVALIAVLISVVVWASIGSVKYRLATAPSPSNFILLARADGVLGGQVNLDGTACFWLGDQQHRGMALSWPWGYSARASPVAPALGWTPLASISRLAVYDETGRRVARIGQRVAMAGGLEPEGVRSILGCSGFPGYWGVGKVVGAR
jgi:hypothetical protein